MKTVGSFAFLSFVVARDTIQNETRIVAMIPAAWRNIFRRKSREGRLGWRNRAVFQKRMGRSPFQSGSLSWVMGDVPSFLEGFLMGRAGRPLKIKVINN